MSLRKELEKTERFTPNEQKIVTYLLDHEQAFLSLTVRELAAATFTSPAAVMRMIKKVFDGSYTDFKIRYAAELQNRSIDEEALKIRPIKRRETPYSIQKKIRQLMINTILETENNLDYKQLERISTLLTHADHIDIYAEGLNEQAANKFKYLMMRIGIHVAIVTKEISDITHVLLNSNSRHVAIFISHRGENQKVIDRMKLNFSYHVKIIYITGFLDERLKPMCDEIITIESGNRFSDLSPIVYSTSTDYVLQTIFGCCFADTYEESMKNIASFAKIAHKEGFYHGLQEKIDEKEK